MSYMEAWNWFQWNLCNLPDVFEKSISMLLMNHLQLMLFLELRTQIYLNQKSEQYIWTELIDFIG